MQLNRQEFWESLKSGKITQLICETAPQQQASSSHEIFNIMKPIYLQEPDVEKMYGIFMNGNNEILSIEILATGTINQSAVYPREIIKKLLSNKASALILVHNHPSGRIDPSKEDILVTRSILFSCAAIGVSLLDHVIVGREEYFTFADSGQLLEMRKAIPSEYRS